MNLLRESSKSVADAYLAVLYPQGFTRRLRILRFDQGDGLSVLNKAWGQGTETHLVLESGVGIKRVWQMICLLRRLKQQGFAWQLVGLGGSVENPRMMVPLRRNILHYVQSIAFRGTDSPLRVWLKVLSGFLSAGLTWNGPLVLIGSPEADKFDRFVLLTGGRQIAFLFRNGESMPWAVCKSGSSEELLLEYQNHRRAMDILDYRVPAMLELPEKKTETTICMEYIRERFLSNVVAAAIFSKRQVFVREALGHLEFCREVYRLLVAKTSVEHIVVTESEIDGLLQGIDDLLKDSPDASIFRQAFARMIGITVPRLIQHGDFCARNVLIADGDRGRVLIDWEDMQELRWPLVDFVLLRLSLKEVYASLFGGSLDEMERVPVLAKGIKDAEVELANLLNMNQVDLTAGGLLSLACLCRQNLRKGRPETASAIFRELMATL